MPPSIIRDPAADPSAPVAPARIVPETPTQILTRHEAAVYLRLSLAGLDNRTRAGEIPSIKIGRRRLYRAGDVDRWLAGRVTGGEPA